MLTKEAELIQDKLAKDSMASQKSMTNRLTTAGDFQTATQKVLGMKQDQMANALNNMQKRAENVAGNVQDLLGQIMETRADKKWAKWGLI